MNFSAIFFSFVIISSFSFRAHVSSFLGEFISLMTFHTSPSFLASSIRLPLALIVSLLIFFVVLFLNFLYFSCRTFFSPGDLFMSILAWSLALIICFASSVRPGLYPGFILNVFTGAHSSKASVTFIVNSFAISSGSSVSPRHSQFLFASESFHILAVTFFIVLFITVFCSVFCFSLILI